MQKKWIRPILDETTRNLKTPRHPSILLTPSLKFILTKTFVPVFPRVVDIVYGCRDEAYGFVYRVTDFLDVLSLEKEGSGMQHVGRVRGVVIRVGAVVVGLDQGQPVLERRLGAIEGLVQLKPKKCRHSQPNQTSEDGNVVFKLFKKKSAH